MTVELEEALAMVDGILSEHSKNHSKNPEIIFGINCVNLTTTNMKVISESLSELIERRLNHV